MPGSSFPWVITMASDDTALGMIEARTNGTALELGYVLSRRMWGQGLMTEAVEAIADWSFGEDEIWRLWAVADVDNLGSCRALDKAGLTREGRLHRWASHPNIAESPRDVWCYARWRTAP